MTNYAEKGCVMMRCNGLIVKTRKEFNKLNKKKNNHYEVEFLPFHMMNIGVNENNDIVNC